MTQKELMDYAMENLYPGMGKLRHEGQCHYCRMRGFIKHLIQKTIRSYQEDTRKLKDE